VVHFHTLQTKQQSKQWLGNGQPGPIKAKVQATRSKMIVLAFFLASSTPTMCPGSHTVNTKYIMDARDKFMRVF
jgi:hypothetical protein